jgi:hypothetical protein
MKLVFAVLIALFALSFAQGGILCQPCQLGVQLVKDFANKPDEELIKMLVAQCDRLPENARGACKVALNLAGREIIRYVRANLTQPNLQICQRFRLCSRTADDVEVLTLAEEKQDTPLCAPCQLGVQLVKDYLSKPDEELLAMLLRGCDALPEQLTAPCKMAITLVGGQMIAYIRTHLRESPRQICARFRLCGATVEEAVEVKQDTPLCAPCQLGVQLVKDYISKPDEELLAMLLRGCDALPEQLTAPCKMAVTLVGGQMIAFIRNNLRESPRAICARFRLCGASDAVAIKKQDGPLCTPCQLAVNLVKDYLTKPDEELLRLFLNLCENLPEQFQAYCKMAVTIGGKQVLDLLRANLRGTPRELCSRLGACGRSAIAARKVNPFRCALKCLGEGWNIQKVMALIQKCKRDKACYVKEIGKDKAECVFSCFQ